jgi:hypothetical protein
MLICKNISEIEAREFGCKEAEFQFQFLGHWLVRFTWIMCLSHPMVSSFQLHACFLCKMSFRNESYGLSNKGTSSSTTLWSQDSVLLPVNVHVSESCACAWIPHHQIRGRAQLKCDGTWWHMGGEVKGKLANGVGSQYSSHCLRTWCILHYYSWCAHLGCQ